MSNETQNITQSLSDEEVAQATGGASDYTQQGCPGMKLDANTCFFCTRRVDGQHHFPDGLKNTVGCGLSSGFLGSVNGAVLVSNALKNIG